MADVDTAAVRALATTLRGHAQDVRDWGTTHVDEALSMQWHSTSSQAFVERTSSDEAALSWAAHRVELAADAMDAHADAVDAIQAREAAEAAEAAEVAAEEAAQGHGPGRAAI